MFLKQIKMMGFKSFIETTTLQLNAQKIAVVGPNGCGKSNVIDAIRWVMGESSARFLRGDLMSDVIFNGSLHRKPLSIAMVEMILDNGDGYLQGAYVKKGDVSLKREINRAGESTYYINHQKVRRKDLTDLWLGTGAGARGYAIIGQNMVNQLVEANPEVLKHYLEEAAGVSKYKERRKESAERLAQIADNLSRIADMLSELEQTVLRLEKESQDAIRFQEFRQKYRMQQALLQRVIAKRTLDKQSSLQKTLAEQEMLEQQNLQEKDTLMLQISSLDVQCQTLQTELQQMEQAIFKEKIHLQQQQEYLAKRQQEFQRYQQEKNQFYQEQQELNQQQLEEKIILLKLQEDCQNLQSFMQETQTQLGLQNAQRQALQAEIRDKQQKRAQIRQKHQQYFTQLQVLNAKKEQTLQMLSQLKIDIENLKQSVQQSDCDEYAKKINHLESEVVPIEKQLAHFKEQLQVYQQNAQHAKDTYEHQRIAFQESQARFDFLRQDMLGKEAGYQGLLSSYTPENLNLQEPWLTIKNWLADWKIPIEWQKTMDWLWQHFLPTYYCQSGAFPEEPIPKGGVFYACMQKVIKSPVSSLLQHMQVDWVPAGFFDWQALHVASNFADAKKLVSKLKAHESVLCPEGIWLGSDWIYYLPLDQTTHQGLATRLNEWRLAQSAYDAFKQQFEDSQQALESSRNQYQYQQLELEKQSRLLEEKERLWFEQQQQLQTLRQQHQFLLQEQVRLRLQWQQAEEKYAQKLGQVKEWQTQIEEYQTEDEKEKSLEHGLSAQLEGLQESLAEVDKAHAQFSSQLQEQQLSLTRFKTQHEHMQAQHPKTVGRLQLISQKIIENLGQLEKLENEINYPQDHWMEQSLLIQKKEEQLHMIQKDCQYKRSVKEGLIQELELIKNKHLAILEKKWKILSEKEQNQTLFDEMKDKLDVDMQDIPADANEGALKKYLEQLEMMMQEMGDVNLLAVGLYHQEKERQTHLLDQQFDLKQAIAELEGAIQTLDQDMHRRLQETLLAINQHLTEIFPQLFGGGEAKFVASCDNLLEASVAVHVQLPGKKQHRIQLLSGGEKALTAVALLFSIFSLNPAPFCLLDEVDAALDDANVQRLAGLIDKLSKSVQFMLITHNPLTMDVADELIGVTMQEPGVSRVVSVNMAKALEMVNKE